MRIAVAILAAVIIVVGTGTSSALAAEVTPARLDVGESRQVVVVMSSSWSTSYATLQTWQKNSDGTRTKPFGAMRARIGSNGFKRDVERRQNSGTTRRATT